MLSFPVGRKELESLLIVTINTAKKVLSTAHHVSVPVLKERKGVRLFAGIAFWIFFLHVFQNIQQVIHGVDFRASHRRVVIPADIRAVSKVISFGRRSGALFGNLTWHRVNFSIRYQTFYHFGGFGILGEVRAVINFVCQINEKPCLCSIRKAAIFGSNHYNIAEVSCCRTCFKQGVTAAGDIRCNQIKGHIEFVFYDISEPTGLNALVIGLRVEYRCFNGFLIFFARCACICLGSGRLIRGCPLFGFAGSGCIVGAPGQRA